MPSQSHTVSSRSSASSSCGIPPQQLMALPSVSYSLSTLPQATSLSNVALHPVSMSAQRAAESEEKLRRALSKSAASPPVPPHSYVPHSQPYSPGSNPPLMMRKPVKSKIQI